VVLRIAIALVMLAVPAGAEPEIGGVLGLGGGPARIAGTLAERFSRRGPAGQLRMGFQIGRAGAEVRFALIGLDDHADLESPVLLAVTPSATVYLVSRRPFQLLARGGLGFGSLTGSRMTTIACVPPEECLTKLERESVSYPGVSLDAGVTAQLHLGRRTNHAMLWLDLGQAWRRHRVEGSVETGRTRALVIGIADAF
jgi:hypothetical protein